MSRTSFFCGRAGECFETTRRGLRVPRRTIHPCRERTSRPTELVKNKIRERDDRRPVAGNGWRDFRHRAVQKCAYGRAVGEAVRFCVRGEKEAAQQSEREQALAVFEKRFDHNRGAHKFLRQTRGVKLLPNYSSR